MRKPVFGGLALAVLALAYTGLAEEPSGLSWDHEGYAKLPDAAAVARESGKRLLLGLSGSPT